MSKLRLPALIVVCLLFFDQALKFWVKTKMMIGEEIPIFGHWFNIHFVENNGMAFGVEFGGETGKLILSIFRIIAVFGIAWYIVHLAKRTTSTTMLVCMSLIFTGAVGNILDSAFYGLIFDHSYNQVSALFPENGGYAGFLQGRVVDMLYFPIIDAYMPEWVPFIGSERFIFFSPVFNIADSCITIGVITILIFQRSFFNATHPQNPVVENEVVS